MVRVSLTQHPSRACPCAMGLASPGQDEGLRWDRKERASDFWPWCLFQEAKGRERPAWWVAALPRAVRRGWPACLCPCLLSPRWLRPQAALSPQKRQGQGRRRRRRRLRSVRWSSSSEDSSSEDSSVEDSSSGDSKDSGDSEPEPEEAPDAQESGQALPSAQHTVPDIDLWIPARQSAHPLKAAGAEGCPERLPASPNTSNKAQGGSRKVAEVGQAQPPSRTQSASLRGVGYPHSTDTHPTSSEGPADEVGMALVYPRLGGLVAAAQQSPRQQVLSAVGQPNLVPALSPSVGQHPPPCS